MNIVLDIGNTSSKIAFFKGGVLVEKKTVSINELKQVIKNSEFDGGIISSVKVSDTLDALIKGNDSIIVLNKHLKTPITNNYSSPDTLGYDRLANAVGAFALSPNKNNLIIDAGTCLKFDFINSDNQYLGGSISPGLMMRAKALHTFTDKLPLIELFEATKLIGDSTLSSILSGLAVSYTHLTLPTILLV